MNHPFQCIEAISPRGTDDPGYLIAASGPQLISTCLKSGSIVSKWTAGGDSTDPASAPSSNCQAGQDDGRPAKKQKTSLSGPAPPNVIKLTISPDQQHVVAVTDDKCVRVLAISQDGQLEELSQRTMPKRPCAIQVLPDNATILCGDKFGDVYSLPLLPKDAQQPVSDLKPSPAAESTFKPSATPKTVHTQRNLKALEAQKKQKNLTPKAKQPLAFEHKLLLGHVSMLTDLAYATQVVDGRERGYIITADRDEHIRVSRGPPQSHIIEGYCLGHKEFVSKIRAIPGTDLLVSGGGDDWIGIWKWPDFRIVGKFTGLPKKLMASSIAVSGIWTVPLHNADKTEQAVAVACERSSILAICAISKLLDAGEEDGWSYLDAGSPMLDVAVAGSMMVVSLDSRDASVPRLKAYEWRMESSSVSARNETDMEALLQTLNHTVASGAAVAPKDLDDFLYGVENMRKRGRHDDAPDEEADQAEDAD